MEPCDFEQSNERYFPQRGIYYSEGNDNLINGQLYHVNLLFANYRKNCSLIIDDTSIKEKMYYSRTEDKFYGSDTVTESEEISREPTLANKMLCYVIHGMTTKLIIPAANFFHKTLQTTTYLQLILNVLQLLHKCGFTVLRIVTNNHKPNVGLFKFLSEGSEDKSLCVQVIYPVEPTISLFLSHDYCHVIKKFKIIIFGL